MKKNPTIQLKCECSSESLEVEYDVELNQYFICMWEKGHSSNMSLRERIRWCWNVLRTGRPYTDEIILNKTCVKRLVRFLENNLK